MLFRSKCIADWFGGDELYSKVLLETETVNAELFVHSLYKGMKAHKIIIRHQGLWFNVTLRLHKTDLVKFCFIYGDCHFYRINPKAVSKKDATLLQEIITPIIEPYIK